MRTGWVAPGCFKSVSVHVSTKKDRASTMLSVRVLLLLGCLAALSGADRQKRSAWFFGPQYSASHYYSGSHVYHHGYPSKPACSSKRPCYDYTLLFTSDALINLSDDPDRLRDHYADAGFDKAGVVAEGKHAAVFFLHQFGVNATGLPDYTYLAPNVKFPGDVMFSFKVESPPRPKRLTMAAKKDWVQFYNLPVRVAYWEMTFGKDFHSTGAIKGLIPAGSASRYGSYLIDTCPQHYSYQRCDHTLSAAPRGRLLIRFWNRGLRGVVVDDVLEHKEWGKGAGRGVRSPDLEDNDVVHGRVVLTFPESCGGPKDDNCYPRGIVRKSSKIYNDYW